TGVEVHHGVALRPVPGAAGHRPAVVIDVDETAVHQRGARADGERAFRLKRRVAAAGIDRQVDAVGLDRARVVERGLVANAQVAAAAGTEIGDNRAVRGVGRV